MKFRNQYVRYLKSHGLRSAAGFIALIVLSILTAITSSLISWGNTAQTIETDKVMVTNIGSQGATIVWRTNKLAPSCVFYKEKGTHLWNGHIVCEQQSRTHHVTITGLDPQKEHEFQGLYNLIPMESIQGSFSTVEIAQNAPQLTPIYGSVYNEHSTLYEDGIVIIETDNIVAPLSVRLSSENGWGTDLSLFREIGMENISYYPSHNSQITITAVSGFGEVKKTFALDSIQPVEDMVMYSDTFYTGKITSDVPLESSTPNKIVQKIYGVVVEGEESTYEEDNNSETDKVSDPNDLGQPDNAFDESNDSNTPHTTDQEINRRCQKTCIPRGLCAAENGTVLSDQCDGQNVCCDIAEVKQKIKYMCKQGSVIKCDDKDNCSQYASCSETIEVDGHIQTLKFGCVDDPIQGTARCNSPEEANISIEQEKEKMLEHTDDITTKGQLSGQVYPNRNDRPFCVRLDGTEYAITQGQYSDPNDKEGTHPQHCAIDLSGFKVPLAAIVPTTPGVTEQWCTATYDREFAKGCYIILGYSNGETLGLAHLDYDLTNCEEKACEDRISGSSGTREAHVHMYTVNQSSKYNPQATPSDCLYNHPCDYIPGGCYRCGQEVVEVGYNPSTANNPNTPLETQLMHNLIQTASAEETNQNDTLQQYVRQQELDSNTYSVSGNGITTKTIELYDDSTILYYYDENQNGKKDREEKYLTPVDTDLLAINYEKLADTFTLDLVTGWSLIALPFVLQGENTSDIHTASEFLDFINSQGGDVTHIVTFRKGKFLTYALRENSLGQKVPFGEDFSVMPGEGYYIRNYTAGTFRFKGNEINQHMQLVLDPGWNLVGFSRLDLEGETTTTFLKKLNKSGIPIKSIHDWESGKYQGTVFEDSQVYGLDRKLNWMQGYFLRIDGNNSHDYPTN